MAQALMIAGTAIGAVSTILGAKSQAKGLKSEAAQLDYNAGQERAASQRGAIEEKRQGRLASSRALALAAASGGGADDPNVVNTIAGIEGESEYRALTSLWEGDQSARNMEREAAARRKQAKSVKLQGYLSAAGSILGAGASLYDRYGGGTQPKPAASTGSYSVAYGGMSPMSGGRTLR